MKTCLKAQGARLEFAIPKTWFTPRQGVWRRAALVGELPRLPVERATPPGGLARSSRLSLALWDIWAF
eukprot:CAMPEP_0174934114 /NCGR_PEP_ID=MMETSP1355-20121228/48324_1 /TAXON_ID=464990 /ORGANISM="Hemiselmis tepida, Strain CCMP443" /LENGTH=67 /DNA_ID=CAMNT_0016180681 /DNA_START=32 /DNA_END=235 /DNA_ORIENTATION=+